MQAKTTNARLYITNKIEKTIRIELKHSSKKRAIFWLTLHKRGIRRVQKMGADLTKVSTSLVSIKLFR
jgi:hypothetical protein